MIKTLVAAFLSSSMALSALVLPVVAEGAGHPSQIGSPTHAQLAKSKKSAPKKSSPAKKRPVKKSKVR